MKNRYFYREAPFSMIETSLLDAKTKEEKGAKTNKNVTKEGGKWYIELESSSFKFR
ncbi:hypothetical protein L2D08_17425 [Domibacillus sp. PGB-M46]|uniref:hypothetical protein n=1 Tax=Domibacillus sp. PGB-M46 TaxID=2910255 RepID=UPI001F55C895|nr:hypothetical protein [Domibacillus sp. PGB-M46]MCI2256132.1 hypothetical protein [Domibacillus sp. PGB-M46]